MISATPGWRLLTEVSSTMNFDREELIHVGPGFFYITPDHPNKEHRPGYKEDCE
jgi:hypothetical protein